MFVLADILRLTWAGGSAGAGLVAHAADVRFVSNGFVWRVRRRSPAFQRGISGLVELSTEGLVLTWLLALAGGLPAGAWVDALIPTWLVVLVCATGLVLTWEGRGRSVRVVRLHADALVVDRRTIPLEQLESVEAASSGWGPWRTAEVTVRPRHRSPLRFAADGDDNESLRMLTGRIEQARLGKLRRAG